jgi:hypothetical protein
MAPEFDPSITSGSYNLLGPGEVKTNRGDHDDTMARWKKLTSSDNKLEIQIKLPS